MTALAEMSISEMRGPKTTLNQESGGASNRAICSAICSVTVFGMSSPRTTLRYVNSENEMMNATVCGMYGSK